MKKSVLYIFFLFLPCLVISQQWRVYSDSIISNINKNNLEKASYFIELADKDIEKSTIVRDTLYADYIYRKGVVKSFLGDYDTTLLKQSLDIWESIAKKNYLKIMKINYFIGMNYFQFADQTQKKEYYDISYKYFEKCYILNLKYKLGINNNFINSIYRLAQIDEFNDNLIKAKEFATEFVEIVNKKGVGDFNFEYLHALRLKKDYKEHENILQQYLDKYNAQKINNPEILFYIYYQLFNNKLSYLINDAYLKYPQEIIQYGEKTLQIAKENNLKHDLELNEIYLQLHIAYGQIKDNINAEKYRKLNYEYYSKNNEIDFWDEIEKLYNENDYVNFKIKFDEYEIKFKKENQFNDLLEIYKYSLTLFERSILFTRDDIEKQIELVNKNRNSLTNGNKLFFDELLVEFNIVIGQYNKALEICNNNLNINDLETKLSFSRSKAACEEALGYKQKANKTTIKNLELAISIYGDKDPRLLPFLNSILDMDLMGTNPNSIKIETKALKILYENKLEKTVTAISLWNNLGQVATNRNNYKDAIIYFEKSIAIIQNTKTINNPNLYLSSLYGIVNVYIQQNNFVKANEYLNKYKKYLDENPNMMTIQNEGYYYSLGNYFFQQDKFLDAKINYEKSFTYYDSKNSIKKIRYFLSNYFLENNSDELLENIKNYQKENKDTFWGWGIIYLLKYNLGDFEGAKNILVNQLDKLILDNNKYFHLLSNDEKEKLYKTFTNQFEYLNSYLLENNSKFLEKYIYFRFYSKSLLFSNSFKSNGENEKNKELYEELRSNTIQINKAIETKSVNLNTVEELKNKNREIEKFLSANTKPLAVQTLQDLTNNLKFDDAYIEIIRINKQSKNSIKKPTDIIKFFTDSISYGAIVIKKNSSPKFILIDGSNQLEKQYADRFKSKIINKEDDTETYDLLFEKIDNELNDVKKIYLVTDGIYNSINIESIYNPYRKQYLIDYLKIQPIQNVRTITDEKKDLKIGLNTKSILFGNPDFYITISNKNLNDFSSDRGLDNTLLDAIKKDIKIKSLKGTEREIETLDAILKDSKSTVELFSKFNATEDNLKNIQSPDILHIATHGYFLSNNDTSKTKQSIANLINENYKDDSYLKSGLLLAGVQNTLNGKQVENSNNGILTAEEAKSLNLKNTELVVLSACETGLGDNLVGEGVIGLQRAFMIAGAKSVIMSLWSVSDEKTQELMTLFYTNWIKNNLSKEEALYQAKIEMKKLYPQPYYWAGFVLLE